MSKNVKNILEIIVESANNIVENVDKLTKMLDKNIKNLDIALKSVDSKLLGSIPESIIKSESEEFVMSPSYPGQSPIDYCLECLPAGTIIYGNHGLYRIEKLRAIEYGVRARVLTHKGRGMTPIKFFSREYSGPIVVIKQYYTNIPLKITPEHPVLAVRNVRKPGSEWQDRGVDESRVEWVPAKDLTVSDFMAFPRIKEVRDLELVSEGLAELFGWYVAEGCLTKNKRGLNVTFSLGRHEKDRIERVIGLIERVFGSSPSVTEKGSSVRITISSKYYAPLFEQFGIRAEDKDIPTWFLYLPEKKQYAFLKGYFGGDGYVRNMKKGKKSSVVVINAATVSMNLAYRLRLLLFRLGILNSIMVVRGGRGVIEGRDVKVRDAYHIRITGGSAMKLLENIGISYVYEYSGGRSAGFNYGWVEENYVFIPIRSVSFEEFSGVVYNIHVDEDESYLTIHGALHNCLSRHHIKALGLLEEAERFSINKGVITPEARKRIEAALKEIVTSEEDLKAPVRDPELARIIDEIKAKQREFRKWVWSEGLLTVEDDLNKLREAIRRVDYLVDLTRKASELYDLKYGKSNYYSLASELSEKYSIDINEALKLIRGLLSDKHEDVLESVEKLKNIGALDYITERVGEMIKKPKPSEEPCITCLINPRKFFEELCNMIGSECWDLLDQFKNGKISANELYVRVRKLGESKGITDDDINKLINKLRGIK